MAKRRGTWQEKTGCRYPGARPAKLLTKKDAYEAEGMYTVPDNHLTQTQSVSQLDFPRHERGGFAAASPRTAQFRGFRKKQRGKTEANRSTVYAMLHTYGV